MVYIYTNIYTDTSALHLGLSMMAIKFEVAPVTVQTDGHTRPTRRLSRGFQASSLRRLQP